MYKFDLTWFIIGLLIVIFGAVVLKYYNKFAEITGVGNYSRWQIVGFVLIGLGFLSALNIPAFLIELLVNSVMSGY
jgi:hypothetical protein